MKIKIINEQEVFAINPSLTIQTKNIGKYKIAIADNFYKNPEMVRELILTIPSTINETHKGGMVGRRVEAYYDLSPLADPFYKILTNLWDYTKNWSYDAIYEMFKQASFIGNIMNEEMLEPRTPHQDGPMTFPKQFISSRTGFASSVFLNTPEECSGGTALYTYKGEQSPLQMPEQSVDHFITESEGDWEKIGLIEMKWNRLVIYNNFILHTPYIKQGMGFTGNIYRINQMIFP